VTGNERRQSRRAPEARLRSGWNGFAPELTPGTWYSLETTQPPQPFYVWLKTPHGAVAWQRDELELRDGPIASRAERLLAGPERAERARRTQSPG
jgi:hypothetical protein